MSRANVEMARELFDLWKKGPTDVPTELVAPEIESVSPLASLRGRQVFTDRDRALETAALEE